MLWKSLGIPENCAHCLQLSSNIALLYEPCQGALCYKKFSWLLSNLNYSQLKHLLLKKRKTISVYFTEKNCKCHLKMMLNQIALGHSFIERSSLGHRGCLLDNSRPQAGKNLLVILRHWNSCHVQDLLQEGPYQINHYNLKAFRFGYTKPKTNSQCAGNSDSCVCIHIIYTCACVYIALC